MPTFSISGPLPAVTGASSGIGEASANIPTLSPEQIAAATIKGIETDARTVAAPTTYRLLFLLNRLFAKRFEDSLSKDSLSKDSLSKDSLEPQQGMAYRKTIGVRELLARILIASSVVVFIGASCEAKADTRTLTVKVGELNRTYSLHVPPSLPKNRALALVLMFHGGGGTPAFAERESNFNDLADREQFLVAYPEGFHRSWNDGRADRRIPAQRNNIDDLSFIRSLLDDITKNYQVDPNRVYATGISNGGIFTHYLAANLSSRVAAIAPVSAGLPITLRSNFKPEKPVSVLMLQSADDPIVPYSGGDIQLPGGAKRVGIVATEEAVAMWVSQNGSQRNPAIVNLPDKDVMQSCHEETFTYANGKEGAVVVLHRITGGGHSWPGGVQYLPSSIVGRVCRNINATQIIWEFFRAHPRP